MIEEIDWQCDEGICEHADRIAGKCACYNKEQQMTKKEVKELPYIDGEISHVC